MVVRGSHGDHFVGRGSLIADWWLPRWLCGKESTVSAGDTDAWVQSLGWEDPLEKEMATHSSTLAWKIPWAKETGRLRSMGS